jgi:hypothetical protein
VGHELGIGRGRRPNDGLHLRALDQVHGCNTTAKHRSRKTK